MARNGVAMAASIRAGLLLALAATVAVGIGLGGIHVGEPGAGSATPARAGSAAGAAVPATARAQVSAALGAARPAFGIRSTRAGGLVASNPAQGLSASFAPAGVSVAKEGLNLHLSLRSVGFGEGARRQRALAAAAPRARANGVTYARGAVSEWYANGPIGLEQGFTLKRAPAGAASGEPLTLELGFSANARPALAADGQSFTVRSGDALLRYGSLLSTDASGRPLRTWLALEGGRLSIRVDAARARYPLRIDPLVQAGGKLTGSDEQGAGQLGTSVALSADGGTLLVGGPRDASAEHGAAWVFVRQGSAWVQQGSKLTGAEPPGGIEEENQCAEEAPEEAEECAFGNSVALSADGDTALIGEPSSTARPGSAWVFTRSGTTWSRAAVLTGGGGSWEGRFGKSVALSADGATALIGDPSASLQRGAAWVFVQGGSGWQFQARLTDAEESHTAHLGRSVALSADGDTALIGGPGDSGFKGAAWSFTRGPSGWTQQVRKLVGGGESGQGHFGKSVALSGDGARALVGGLTDAEGRGAVWPFARSGAAFVQDGEKITGASEGEPHFGYSVAISGDGTVAAVGSPRAEISGLVTVLTRSASGWQPAGEQLAGSAGVGKSWTGASVAVSQDGTVIGVGGPHDSARTGAAWVFTGSSGVALPPPAIANVAPGAGEAGTTVKIKGENFTGAEAVLFGSQPATFVVKSALTIEAVVPPGPVGTVDVTVRTPSGVSALNAGDKFRYTTSGAESGGEPAGGTGTSTGTGQTSHGSPAAAGVLGATGSAAAACRLTLGNKHLAVTGFRTVALRLQRTGTGACRGKLTLSFNRGKRGKRARLQTIGAAMFSLGSGSSEVLKIDLTKAGRKLFRGHGGRLNASLSFVRSVPAPRLARSASVRLTWKKTKQLTLGG
jgi:hypothetical protein